MIKTRNSCDLVFLSQSRKFAREGRILKAKRLGNISLAVNIAAIITSLLFVAVAVVFISARFHNHRHNHPIDYECFLIQDGSGSILACQ